MAETKISEKTLFSWGVVFVFVAAAIAVGAAFAHGDDTTKRLDKIETKQEKYTETVQSIDSRLSRIEGKLERKSGD